MSRQRSNLAALPLLVMLTLLACRPAPEQATASPSPAEAASVPTVAPPGPPSQEEQALAQRLEAHVRHLAEEIGLRNMENPEKYEEAAVYIERQMKALGYEGTRQTYKVDSQDVANLIFERPGGESTLVVGAHYDTIGLTPGADDNASGCAALLELARLLKEAKGGPTVRLVFFANEEPRYFQTQNMGSVVYAQSCAERGDELAGMLSLETMGFYSDEPDSQHFPVGITGYPTTGNFLGFVSNLNSKPLMERCLKTFREHSTLPAEGLAAPEFLDGIGWSDHWSFWKAGYQAVMVTDTAPFRNPHYHARTDTPDTLDYPRLARAVLGLKRVVLSF